MSNMSSMFGHLPGMGTLLETFEQAYTWGPWVRYYLSAYIDSAASDPTNTPTWNLRPGLVMGLKTSTFTWTNYSPNATDGSEVARGVLPIGLRMQDVFTGVNTTKFYSMMASGGVQGAKLIGLDLMARAQLSQQFLFDDNLAGNQQFPFQRFQNKTANYQLTAADNLSLFSNLGAIAEVDFTLPAIANGYFFAFSDQAAQTLKVISKEGGNIVAFNNLTANNIAYSTGGQQIGGGFYIYSNNAGTKWIVENSSAGTNTITVA